MRGHVFSDGTLVSSTRFPFDVFDASSVFGVGKVKLELGLVQFDVKLGPFECIAGIERGHGMRLVPRLDDVPRFRGILVLNSASHRPRSVSYGLRDAGTPSRMSSPELPTPVKAGNWSFCFAHAP